MSLATSANILFDTNIYLRVLSSDAYATHHHERFAQFAPRTYLCSVVAGELYAGTHTVQRIDSIRHLAVPVDCFLLHQKRFGR